MPGHEIVTTPQRLIELLKVPNTFVWLDVNDKDMTVYVGQPNGKQPAVIDMASPAWEALMDNDLCPTNVTGWIPDIKAVRDYEHKHLKQQQLPVSRKKPRRKRAPQA